MPAMFGPIQRPTGIASAAPMTNPAPYARLSRTDRTTDGYTPSSAASGAKYGSEWPTAYRAAAHATTPARTAFAVSFSRSRQYRHPAQGRTYPRNPLIRTALRFPPIAPRTTGAARGGQEPGPPATLGVMTARRAPVGSVIAA